jgi:hypothetical protein
VDLTTIGLLAGARTSAHLVQTNRKPTANQSEEKPQEASRQNWAFRETLAVADWIAGDGKKGWLAQPRSAFV